MRLVNLTMKGATAGIFDLRDVGSGAQMGMVTMSRLSMVMSSAIVALTLLPSSNALAQQRTLHKPAHALAGLNLPNQPHTPP